MPTTFASRGSDSPTLRAAWTLCNPIFQTCAMRLGGLEWNASTLFLPTSGSARPNLMRANAVFFFCMKVRWTCMDPHMPSTASDLVNRLGEKELGDLLFHNAQEIAGRRIAKRIRQERREGRITTTQRLARIVADAVGVGDPLSRRSKTHPATRTFLALRIAVNDEMKNLDALLASIPWVLSPGGARGDAFVPQ